MVESSGSAGAEQNDRSLDPLEVLELGTCEVQGCETP
jgi:hypothetical protein